MHTYMKLNDGRIMVIWSDTLDEDGTYNVYPVGIEFDPKVDITEIVHESQIDCIDSNFYYLDSK